MLEEAAASAAAQPARTPAPPTPVSDSMRERGMWTDAWDPFFALDPAWTDAFMAAGVGVYAGGVFEPKLAELLSIAFDASITHMYAPGTRRHIRIDPALFAVLFLVVHVLEEIIVGIVHGRSAASSVPAIGQGGLPGAITAAVILFFVLLPYFLFTGLSRIIGEDRFKGLLLKSPVMLQTDLKKI